MPTGTDAQQGQKDGPACLTLQDTLVRPTVAFLRPENRSFVDSRDAYDLATIARELGRLSVLANS